MFFALILSYLELMDADILQKLSEYVVCKAANHEKIIFKKN